MRKAARVNFDSFYTDKLLRTENRETRIESDFNIRESLPLKLETENWKVMGRSGDCEEESSRKRKMMQGAPSLLDALPIAVPEYLTEAIQPRKGAFWLRVSWGGSDSIKSIPRCYGQSEAASHMMFPLRTEKGWECSSGERVLSCDKTCPEEMQYACLLTPGREPTPDGSTDTIKVLI